jgi:hypothetical protein
MTMTSSNGDMQFPKGDPAELAQQNYLMAQKRSREAEQHFRLISARRQWIAVTLKGITLVGGLAVAVAPAGTTALGVVISLAVLADQLFANHKRLLSETEAANAVSRTLRRVEAKYQDLIIEVVSENRRGKVELARAMLVELARKSTTALDDELDRIKTAVENKNLVFLSTLNIDHPAETPIPQTLDASQAVTPLPKPMAPLPAPQPPAS